MESSPKKQKPPLPERNYRQEPFWVEPFKVVPLETISENTKLSDTVQPLPPQLITPPPAYQCLGTKPPLPSAPQLQQHKTSFNDRIQSYETPQPLIKTIYTIRNTSTYEYIDDYKTTNTYSKNNGKTKSTTNRF